MMSGPCRYSFMITRALRCAATAALTIVIACLASAAAAVTPTVATGSTHTLFLSENGHVWAVGANDRGQLGDGSTSPSTTAVTAIASGVIMIAAGEKHSLALKRDGTVWAWGANDGGQLGLGAGAVDANPHSTPTQIPGLVNVVAISAGAQHSLALTSAGAVFAWGVNDHSQAGGPCGSTGSNVPSPFQVYTSSTGSCTPTSPLGGVSMIAAGGHFNVALKSDGTVVAWGDNTHGQLGNGTTAVDSAVPVSVTGLAGITRIAAGGDHALALKGDTRVAAWGRNDVGQLGDSTFTERSIAVEVSIGLASTKGVALIAGGREHSLIMYQTGPVASFGSNASGQLGRAVNAAGTACGSDQCLAVEMGGYTHAAGVFAGPAADRSFVYIPGDGLFGRFQAAGDNANAELGTGASGADVNAPVPVTEVAAVGDKVGKRTNFRNDANRSDVLWRSTSGGNVSWDYTTNLPNGYTSATLPGTATYWKILATADVNGDGISDVVWRQSAAGPSPGQVLIWLMNGPNAIGSTVVPGTLSESQWEFSGAGDFDGDGRTDLLWRDVNTGQVVIWYMGINGQLDQSLAIGTVSYSQWKIKGIGDVNGDGIQDIIWFHVPDGVVAIWRMAVTGSYQAIFPAAVGAGSAWQIYKIGDFDGDGRDDIFWRNTSDGTNAIWYLKGEGRVDDANFYVATPFNQWRLDIVGDFDGDGREDIWWYDTTNGSVVRWLMQGRAPHGTFNGITPVFQTVPAVGSGWQAVQ